MNNCTICNGKSRATIGNENIIAGIVMCDYCTYELQHLIDANPNNQYKQDLGDNIYQIVNIQVLIPDLIQKVQKKYESLLV